VGFLDPGHDLLHDPPDGKTDYHNRDNPAQENEGYSRDDFIAAKKTCQGVPPVGALFIHGPMLRRLAN
jgi:hypothetical protein